jgi:enoyl-CoA hydratase
MNEKSELLIDETSQILIATLNRPEKLNAMSIDLTKQLAHAVERFRDTPRLKVMLIRATGRYFSAGADLKEGAAVPLGWTGSGLRDMHRRMPSDMRRLWDEIEAIEKPFVVAHQGACVGAGLELSLSCDFRLASKNARYSFPEGQFGLLPATNGVSRLTRIVGPHWARYLVMANMEADADEARIMGLVHKVFPAESFEDDVLQFCRHLEAQNTEQMSAAKVSIELAHDLSAHQAAVVERMANSTLMLDPAYQAAYERHIKGIGGKSRPD